MTTRNMDLFHELKREIKEKAKEEILSRKQLIVLEQSWFKAQMTIDAKCWRCERTENLTLDHVVPKMILEWFGVDIQRTFIEENLRILCKTCNVFKGNRLDFSDPRTKEVLQTLLDKI